MEFVTLWVYHNSPNYRLIVDCVLHFVPLNPVASSLRAAARTPLCALQRVDR